MTMTVDRGSNIDGQSLSIRLLGTVEARLGDRPLTLAGRRTRVLLVVLALSAGRFVSVERIANCLWGEKLPANVRASIHTYIGRLRQAVGAQWFDRETGGYRLCVDPRQVDLLRFADLLERSAAAGSSQSEYDLLADAINMWLDEPFGEWASEWLQTHEIPAWQERYVQAIERKADLDLEAGRASECVRQLHDVVSRYHLRESLWARWLTALHQSGRTAEALSSYEQVRERIAGELGVDPSSQLRAIHAEILASDQSGEHRRTARVQSAAPYQLPAPVRRFVGREDQLKVMDTYLTEHNNALVLHGPAGAGKTTLALHWAHQIAEQFPDGQLWINMRGYDTNDPVTATDALGTLLRAMGVAGHQIPGGQDERAAVWRDLMCDRRALVVLDNGRDSAHVRPLLTHGRPFVLVTSRSQMRSLATREAADRVTVGVMEPVESVELLSKRTRAHDSHDALEELATLCGHLPLALAIAAERVGRNHHTALEAILDPLRGDQRSLDWLHTGGTDGEPGLRAIFDWTNATLDAQAADMLRTLGLAPSARFTREVAAALVGLSVAEASAVIERLVDRHLLIEYQPGWYDLHDLTRQYAKDLALECDTSNVRAGAVRRMRSWYVHTANNVAHSVGRPHPLITLGDPEPRVIPQSFDDSREAFQWVLDHRRAITLVASDAAASDDHATVYTLIPLVTAMFNDTGGHSDSIDIANMAFESAQKSGDACAEVMCAVHVGATFRRRNMNEAASRWLVWARSKAQRIRYPAGEGFALTILAGVRYSDGEEIEGIELLESALDVAHRAGRLAQESDVSNNLALAYSKFGRHDEAIAAAKRSIQIDRELGNVFKEAVFLDSLGTAYLGSGQVDQACAAFGQSCDLHQQLGGSLGYAIALKNLGLAERQRDNLARAKQHWRDCLHMLDEMNTHDMSEISRAELRKLLTTHE